MPPHAQLDCAGRPVHLQLGKRPAKPAATTCSLPSIPGRSLPPTSTSHRARGRPSAWLVCPSPLSFSLGRALSPPSTGGLLKPGFSLRSLDLLGISARGPFLACPEQLSKAKLSNGPRNRLILSGDIHTLENFSRPSALRDFSLPDLIQQPAHQETSVHSSTASGTHRCNQHRCAPNQSRLRERQHGSYKR
jgi:hypothetical protein